MTTQNIIMTGNGAYDEWVKYPAGSASYQCIDDPIGSPDDDATRIFLLDWQPIKKASFIFADISLPAGAVVQKLSVFVRAKSSVSWETLTPFIRRDTTDYSGSSFTLTASYSMYSRDFTTDPSTGSAWTESGINASEIGILASTGEKVYKNVTQVYAVVTYTVSAGETLSGASLLL